MKAQVLTRYLTPDQKMEEIITFPILHEAKYYLQPEVDFDKVMEQDRLDGNTIPRFAVRVDQNYTVTDGSWSELGPWMVWQIGFSAPHASSLNFLISELELPEHSEMFILSKDGRMIHGPITREVVYDRIYATDIIATANTQIIVKCDKTNHKQFSVLINGVCQGIPKPIETRDFGDAEDCNIDINCPQGAGWENERDAVALVLKNGSWWCSGSLVNDQCQDLRPFFLTAFHCIDSDENGSLSSSERNLSNYTFRFKYEAGTPTCPGNSTGTQGTWIVYSGAAFRAANFASDFALAELNGSIRNQSLIALAGWDRRNITPQATTIIHHPAGDAKKITFDNNPAQQTTISGRQCWWLQIDEGATIGGSSGSPYFDQNRRIVGQHFGSGNLDLPVCDREDKFGGRFDLSWMGGGTNDTRLSNWLAGANPPNTVNTIRVPTISTTGTAVGGGFFVCSTNKPFTLTDPIPGSTVTWSVTNTSLFATTGGASTSGSGNIAILRANNSTSSGSAVLTFVMTQAGCNDVVYTQNIWVGKPPYPDVQMSIDPCLDLITLTDANYNPLASVPYQILLSKTCSGVKTFINVNTNTMPKVVHTPLNTGCVVCIEAVTYSNECGTWFDDEIRCKTVSNCRNNFIQDSDEKHSNFYFNINPNPFSDQFIVTLDDVQYVENANIYVFNIQGKIILNQSFSRGQHHIDLANQPSGIYYVQCRNGQNIFTNKIIKL